MGAGSPNILTVVKTHFKASPQKSALLVLLFLVMVGVYARMFLNGPSESADAALIPEIAAPATVPTLTRPQVTAERPERIELTEPLVSGLIRDPFTIRLKTPRVTIIEDNGSGKQPGGAQLVASGLELQGTICCEDPIATINGRILKPGDEINGFVLERVEPRRAYLIRNGVRVTLTLQ